MILYLFVWAKKSLLWIWPFGLCLFSSPSPCPCPCPCRATLIWKRIDGAPLGKTVRIFCMARAGGKRDRTTTKAVELFFPLLFFSLDLSHLLKESTQKTRRQKENNVAEGTSLNKLQMQSKAKQSKKTSKARSRGAWKGKIK